MIQFLTNLKVGLAVVFITASSFVCAQSYTIYPNDTIITNTPFNDLYHYTIQQKNNSGKTIVLSWEQIKLSIPAGWAANLCDNGHCYTDFPKNGTMDSVYNTEYGMLSVAINPDTIVGTASVQYAVWDINTPSKKDTLTWIITAGNSTAIQELENKNTFFISPNPAKNNINIITNLQSGFIYKIIDLAGKEILNGNSKTNTMILSTENLLNGIYHFSISDNLEHTITKKIIIQH